MPSHRILLLLPTISLALAFLSPEAAATGDRRELPTISNLQKGSEADEICGRAIDLANKHYQKGFAEDAGMPMPSGLLLEYVAMERGLKWGSVHGSTTYDLTILARFKAGGDAKVHAIVIFYDIPVLHYIELKPYSTHS